MAQLVNLEKPASFPTVNSISELQSVIKVSLQTLKNDNAAGKLEPFKTKSGKYSTKKIYDYYEKRNLERLLKADGESDSETDINYKAEIAKWKKLQRELLEIKKETINENLVEITKVEEAFVERVQFFKDSLLSFSQSVAPSLINKTSAKEISKILDERINDLIQQYQNYGTKNWKS